MSADLEEDIISRIFRIYNASRVRTGPTVLELGFPFILPASYVGTPTLSTSGSVLGGWNVLVNKTNSQLYGASVLRGSSLKRVFSMLTQQ